jgi:hypothetical protein
MPAPYAARAVAATAISALIACPLAASLQPTVAAADIATGGGREATTAQYRAIKSALRGHLHGHCWFVRSTTLISTQNPRWAVVLSSPLGRGRCDGGDASVHFFLSRTSAHVNRWDYRYSRFQIGGSGNSTPCGPMTVPADIRC